jgi:hypothetical protein
VNTETLQKLLDRSQDPGPEGEQAARLVCKEWCDAKVSLVERAEYRRLLLDQARVVAFEEDTPWVGPIVGFVALLLVILGILLGHFGWR